MNNIHNSPRRLLLIVASMLALISCQPIAQPETQDAQNDSIQNIRVNSAEPTENLVDAEQFPLPNCGGTSELSQSLGTHASIFKSVTIGARATTKDGVEVEVPEVAKLKLEIEVELAYQQTYQSANSRLDTILMSAASGTHVVYVIGWYEQKFSSMVSYSADGKVHEVPYTYKLRIPKIDDSYKVDCLGVGTGNGEQPSPIVPLPEPTRSGGGRPSDCIAEAHTPLAQGNYTFVGPVHVVQLWRQNGDSPWGPKEVMTVVVGDVTIIEAGGSVWTYPAAECEAVAGIHMQDGANIRGSIVVTPEELRSAGMIK